MLSQNFPSSFQTSFWMAAASCWISSSHFVAFPLFHYFTLSPAIFLPVTQQCEILLQLFAVGSSEGFCIICEWSSLTIHPLFQIFGWHIRVYHIRLLHFLDKSRSAKRITSFSLRSFIFQYSWGKISFLESWTCFIGDVLLSHILTDLCKDCQQSCKAWLSPTEATFLSFHHLFHTQDPSISFNSNSWYNFQHLAQYSRPAHSEVHSWIILAIVNIFGIKGSNLGFYQ